MLNEVMSTVATVATAVQTATTTSGGITGFIQNHPIGSVAGAAGASAVASGSIVNGVSIHQFNKKLDDADQMNFFGKPKKKTEKKKDKKAEAKVEETKAENTTVKADTDTAEVDEHGNPIIDAKFTAEEKTEAPECNSNNAEIKEEKDEKPTSNSTKKDNNASNKK